MLGEYAPESLRLALEKEIVARFGADSMSLELRLRASPNVDLIRRELLANAIRLSESMAPELHASARDAALTLGVTEPIEIYQADGAENAAVHLIESPVVLEAQGRLLALMDKGSSLALFGHELGHFLVHGPTSPYAADAVRMQRVLRAGAAPESILAELRAFSMAQELTADRFALLACQDLQAFLKLEMISTTGLSANMLTWDTQAYLAQCTELIEKMLEAGEVARGTTHPEHSVRAYAAWLFSETQEYKTLTGKGLGNRTLSDVDATLARILRAAPIEDASASAHEPVPSEVHACALAGAVLVAAADGQISDREVEALEHAFGALIPDWREFLDVQTARDRFFASALVVTALGTGALRAVFSVLAHVMLTDEQVSPEEVAMILAIAEVLQAQELFGVLLVATLRSIGVSVAVAEQIPASLPMPVTADEAKAALEVFLANAASRGTAVTPRRLLRLAGQHAPTPEVERTIHEHIARVGLIASPELAFNNLDLVIHLSPRSKPRAEERSVVLDEGRAGIRRAVGKLRDELVSGDGRSPSVRLREARSGRHVDLANLNSISTGLAERVVAQVQARKSLSLLDKALETRMPEARRVGTTLVALAREHKTRLDETGADDLFVGYPLLAGAVDGYVVRGPLVLYPVTLSLDDEQGKRRYTLAAKDDEPFVNQSLLRLIFHKRGQGLPDLVLQKLDEIASSPGSSTEALLAELSALGIQAARTHGELRTLRDDLDALEQAKNVFRIDEMAILGLFPQSSSTLLQEYDGMLQALEDPARDLRSVLGTAALLLPAKLRPKVTPIPETMQLLRPAIFADPSQRSIVSRARSTPALVVDGPPGTGKSQVIANLIVDALARGERVAVVCEKRAALDVVVQRLDQLGMRPLLGLVHDVHDDRRSLMTQVADRIEKRREEPHDANALARLDTELAESEAWLSRRATLLRTRPHDAAPTLGELHTICASFDDPPLLHAPSLVHLGADAVVKLADSVEKLCGYADVLGAGTELRRVSDVLGRSSFSALSATDIHDVAKKLAYAHDKALQLETFQNDQTPLESIRRASTALALATEVNKTLAADATEIAFARTARLVRLAPETYFELTKLIASVRSMLGAALRLQLPVRFEVPDGVTHALAVLQHWASRFTRYFSWGWWKARGAVQRSLAVVAPDRTAVPLTIQFVGELKQRVEASTVWNNFDTALRSLEVLQLVPLNAQQLEIRLGELEQAVQSVTMLNAHQAALVSADAWPDGDIESWRLRVRARRDRLEADGAMRVAREALQHLFSRVTELTRPADFASARDCITREGTRIAQADAALEAAAIALHGRCDNATKGDALLLLDLLAGASSGVLVAQRLGKTWATQLITQVESRASDARSLDSNSDGEQAHAAKMGRLDAERAVHAVGHVWSLCEASPLLAADAPAKHQRRTQVQTAREEMLKEAKKQRRTLPLRGYVQRFAGQGLLDLLPVWLLSPETMVTLFPAQPLFDVVIFDEASQCTVANGFPVLSRAKRFVVAGDDKQMPPSAFFSSKADPDDLTEEKPDVQLDRTMLDDESLLTLAATRVERRSLSWHYRCQHESLIAFSNAAFYAGNLCTIPSTRGMASAPAMRWVSVPNAKYSEGENKVEAERVVDVVSELLHRADKPTIGVVTFNVKQRETILDAIDTRQASSPGFAEAWQLAIGQTDLDQRPFVKNLEQVQGDERDVIVFSLGHAPVTRKLKSGAGELYVPARFGPLGQRGGERRLNVAISRAKQEIHLVSSFEPRLLKTDKAKNRGPALFKSYLEYAFHTAHGAHANAQRILKGLSDEPRARPTVRVAWIPGLLPLAAQVAAAVEGLGLRCERDVGISGFRVPVGVYAPGSDPEYRLAVLTDDGVDTLGAFEVHVHRPRVLSQRGWQTMRVTSPEWNRNRAGVLAKIQAAVRR